MTPLPKIIKNQTISSTALTIGTFDGVHIGHQKILQKLVATAKQKGLIPTVLTLFPHPRMVLQGNASIKLLHTIDERIAFLQTCGIENVVVKTFTKTFANLTPEAYVKTILVDELQTKHIIIGYDHRFGKNRSANIEDLKSFAEDYGFTVQEISAQDIEDVVVSSTKIRDALNKGDVALANTFLDYCYFITGIVISGKQLGRKLGFPTANIMIKEDYKLIPKDGVYVVKSIIDDQQVYGMMNIGTNPTVEGHKHSIEVHFFNFEKNVYSKTLKVAFLKRIRDELKFDSIEALKNQLIQDKLDSLRYIDSLQ